MQGERRDERSKRIDLEQPVTLLTSDGHSFAVVLKDISLDGFRIQHRGEYLDPWEVVTLVSHRGTRTRAQIRWITTDEAGGIFLDTPEERFTC